MRWYKLRGGGRYWTAPLVLPWEVESPEVCWEDESVEEFSAPEADILKDWVKVRCLEMNLKWKS